MICSNCGGKGIKKVKDLLRHQDQCFSAGWQEVLNLRQSGEHDAADRKVRKLLGVWEPMSEEAKAKLKEYYEEHKEEIQARQKLKYMTKKALKERLKKDEKQVRRKKR